MKIISKTVLISFLIIVIASAVSAMPTINSVYLEEADNFYSSCEGNNVVHVTADITNSSALVVANAIFDESINCDEDNIIALSDNGDGTWSGECNVSDEAAVSNFESSAITIFAVEMGDENPAINSDTHILLYSMTTPPEQEGSCDRFGSETTNFCEELNFSDVHFVVEIETNGTCQSQFIGQRLPWEDFKPVVKFEFGSLDFSVQETLENLASLGNALHVEITPPGSFGDSLVGVDTMAFAVLNTATNISLYGLPFATEPLICEYGSENCGEGAGISGVNYFLESPYVIEVTCEDIAYDDAEEFWEQFDSCSENEECEDEVISEFFEEFAPNFEVCYETCYDNEECEELCAIDWMLELCDVSDEFTMYVPNGTLEFGVSHFSDYSISDDEAPIVKIISPTAEESVGPEFSLNVNINGTGSQISSVTIYNNEEIIGEFDYVDLFSYCRNNDEGWTELMCTFVIDVSTDEDLNLTVEAIDFAGDGGLKGSDNAAPVYFDLCGNSVYTNFTLTRDWNCSEYEDDAVSIEANDVTFDCDGHNITGAGAYAWEGQYAAIYTDYQGSTIKNCVLSDFDYGVYIAGGDNATVQNNTIINMGTGVWGNTGVGGWIKIIGNEINNSSYGIDINSGYDGDVVYDNRIYNVDNTAISLRYLINANVSNNVIEDFTWHGIFLNYVDDVDVIENEIGNSEVIGLWGIYSDNTNNVVIRENTVNNTENAIYVSDSSEGAEVISNDITNVYTGIWLSVCNGVKISDNDISLANTHAANGILLQGEGESSNHIVDGNIITISGGTFTGDQYGIKVADDNNSITNNILECTGVISDGETFGIYIGPHEGGENLEDNSLSGNEVSGCNYGLFTSLVWYFSAENEEYHDNYYGAYLESTGSEESMPELSNSQFYDNADYGVYLTGSYAEINYCSFERNGEGDGDAGLDVDGTSTAYVTDGDFIGNILHGMYDEGPDYIYWTILDHAICKDNDILIWTFDETDGITFDGGTLELENCTITINDAVVLDTDGNFTSLTVINSDVIANESTELDFGEEDASITLFLDDNVSVTVSVSAMEPTASGTTSGMIALKGISIEVDDATKGELTWALIKIYYDESELTAANIDESTLKIYYYNETAGDWQLEPNQGVDTTNNYVWANVTHFSLFGVFGSTSSASVSQTIQLPTRETTKTGVSGYSLYSISDVELREGYSKLLGVGGGIEFTLNGQSHNITLKSITATTATIEVSSTPQQAILKIEEEKQFDVNGDNIKDLSVVLNSIEGVRANITVKFIQTMPREVSEISPKISEEKIKETSIFLRIIILVAIILVIFFVLKLFVDKKRHKK